MTSARYAQTVGSRAQGSSYDCRGSSQCRNCRAVVDPSEISRQSSHAPDGYTQCPFRCTVACICVERGIARLQRAALTTGCCRLCFLQIQPFSLPVVHAGFCSCIVTGNLQTWNEVGSSLSVWCRGIASTITMTPTVIEYWKKVLGVMKKKLRRYVKRSSAVEVRMYSCPDLASLK